MVSNVSVTLRRRLAVLLVLPVYAVNVRTSAAQAENVGSRATPTEPLPCVRAARDDGKPWEHTSRVLASFPPDTPVPRFLGSFSDRTSDYELHLWRDARGIFGELVSPVSRDGDPPTSRLYEPHFNAASGAFTFIAFPDELTFSGQLRRNTLSGTFKRGTRSSRVVLRKPTPDSSEDLLADFYTSRAQFDCAMILFHRY
jgi:hypothetical protein